MAFDRSNLEVGQRPIYRTHDRPEQVFSSGYFPTDLAEQVIDVHHGGGFQPTYVQKNGTGLAV